MRFKGVACLRVSIGQPIKGTTPSHPSNGMLVGEFIFVLSALTDVFIRALDDKVLTVAEKIRRGDEETRI